MRELFDFLESPERNKWIHIKGLNLYVRKSRRRLEGEVLSVFDIANVNADNPGNGSFTRLLSELEGILRGRFDVLYVENVLRQRFMDFFVRLGYSLDSGFFGSKSFFLRLC